MLQSINIINKTYDNIFFICYKDSQQKLSTVFNCIDKINTFENTINPYQQYSYLLILSFISCNPI